MDEKIKKEVSQVLKNVSHNVRLTYFSKEKGCPLCKKQQEIIAEIVSLSRKLELQVYDIEENGKEAERYHIEKVPATAVIGKKDYGIRFYGLTGGHEFTSLINAIIMVGTDRSGLHPELEKLIKKIEQPVHIEVMVTLTCPYCPQAVHAAQQLAMVNDHINADMVDSAEFPDLAQRYEVFETPKTVINETHSFVGAQPVQAVYLEVLKAVDPREYERIDQMIRETQGHRHVKKPELQTKYDTIIVGGGPAAMSAAIYAARKEMNVLLVAKELGGQITYTANVENYLGLPNLSGRNMRDQFLVHMEQYPIAESVGANVLTVGKKIVHSL